MSIQESFEAMLSLNLKANLICKRHTNKPTEKRSMEEEFWLTLKEGVLFATGDQEGLEED